MKSKIQHDSAINRPTFIHAMVNCRMTVYTYTLLIYTLSCFTRWLHCKAVFDVSVTLAEKRDEAENAEAFISLAEAQTNHYSSWIARPQLYSAIMV